MAISYATAKDPYKFKRKYYARHANWNLAMNKNMQFLKLLKNCNFHTHLNLKQYAIISKQ